MTFDTDKLRALDEAATWRTPEDNSVRAYGAEHQRFAPADKELRHYLRSHVPAILAMAEENKRLREALERIALSGDGEDIFERSTLYGTFQTIARRALGKDKA